MKIGDAFYEIIGDSSGLKGDFAQADKTAQRGVDKMGSGIKQKLGGVFSVMGGVLGAQVVGQAVGAAKDFFTEAIGAGSDAEEMLSKFGVTFGGETQSMANRMDAFAAATGRSKFGLKGMAADFGAVLKGMGLGEEATAGFAGEMAELAVDWGSFANLDSADVMAKFRSAMTGEYESLKSMGIVINAAMVDQELFNMGIEGGAKAATQAQLVQARYNLIMAASGDAIGDAARTAGSWANQQVALKSTWKDFMTEMGQGTTQVLGPLMQQFTGLAQNVLPKIASALTGTVLPAIAQGVDFFGRLFATISDGDLGGLSDVLQDISMPLSNFVLSLGETLPGALSAVKEALAPLMGVFADALPKALEIARNIFADVAPFVMELVGSMSAFIMDQFGGVVSWIQANMPLIQATIETVLGAIQQIWDTVWPYLQKVALTMFENLKAQISTLINAVMGIIKTVMLLIQGDWEGAWTEIKTVAETLLSGIYTIVENTINMILGFFGTSIADMIQAGSDLIQGLIDGIKKKAGDAINAAKSVVNDAIQGAKNLLGIKSPSTVFAEIGINMMSGLAEGIDKGKADVMKRLGETLNEIVKSFARLMEAERVFREGGSAVDISGVMTALETSILQVMETIERIIDRVGYDRIHKLKLTARRLKEVLEAVTVDLSAVKAYDLSGLDTWSLQFESVLGLVLGIIGRARDAYGDKLLETFSALAGYLSDVFGLVKSISLEAMQPLASDDWADGLLLWAEQAEFAGSLLAGWMNKIPESWKLLLAGLSVVSGYVAQVFALAKAIDLQAMVPLAGEDWQGALTLWIEQVKYVGSLIARWLQSIPQVWRDILAGFETLTDDIIKIFEIAKIDPSVTANDSWNARDVQVWMMQLRSLGSTIMDWLRTIAADPVWVEALGAAAGIADNVVKVFDILKIDLSFKVGGPTLLSRLKLFIADLKLAAPILQKGIADIASAWESAEALAADVDLSQKIQDVFGILGLASTIEGLVKRETLGEGEYYTALSNVVTQLIDDLKASAPLLKDGLAEVAVLFGDALQSSIDISGAISEIFGNLSSAVKSISEMTKTKFSLEGVLNMLDDIQQVSNAAAAITIQTEHGDDTAWFAQLGVTIKTAIQEAFESLNHRLDIHFYQDERERAQWSMMFSQQQQQIESISMQLSALAP